MRFSRRSSCFRPRPRCADRYDEQLPEKPARYVTDRAGVLGPGQAEALNAKLEQFEKDTSNQILVWVDKKLPEGFTLDDFTVRAAQKWGVGQKGTNNGAVLFVFADDRKIRIEVGYGLEGALPDVTANRIIDDEIVPRFRGRRLPGRHRRRRGRDDGRGQGRVQGNRAHRGRGPPAQGRSVRHVPDDGHLLRDLLRPAGDLPPQPVPVARRRWLVDGRRRASEDSRAAGEAASAASRAAAEEAASPAAADSSGGGGASGSW